MKSKSIFTIICILFISALAAPAAFAEKHEKASVVFTVAPSMHCQNCENKIKTNLRFEKGVSEIATNLKDNTVTIVYDTAKTNPEKLVDAFKKIGYKATEKKAE